VTSVPVVSVVIPTYNHARFLREALESVRAQSFARWEAIVVNNYSKDDTVDVVASFNDDRIRLENFSNGGIIAASRNRGIALARGRYVAFLDSDDRWYPEKLARVVARLDEGSDLVGHGLRWFGDRVDRNVFCGPERRATFEALLYDGNCLVTSATTVNKASLEAVGGFSENPAVVTAEDYHLWIKLARSGIQMSFLPEVLGEYRFHSTNQTGRVVSHIDAVSQVVQEFFPAPARRGFTTRLRIRRRVGILHYAAGRALQQNGQFARAWPPLFKALATWPFYVKTYGAVALNALRRSASLSTQ
jgi:cellulose synthase/poly-beta-1,6-N-acetylglucosamine synthase-like glycosyltransferase